MNFQEKLASNYYNQNTYPYVSYAEAKKDPAKEAQRKLYNNDANRREAEFKADAFEELDIVGNPKSERLFSLAYDQSHSEGFQGVYNTMVELLDLIT